MIENIKKGILQELTNIGKTDDGLISIRHLFEILDKHVDKYKEYKKEMKEQVKLSSDDGDYESTHVYADELLCKLLIDLGYKEIVDIYEQVGKWYA